MKQGETLEQQAQEHLIDVYGQKVVNDDSYEQRTEDMKTFARKMLEEAAQLAEANADLCSSCTDLAVSIRELMK